MSNWIPDRSICRAFESGQYVYVRRGKVVETEGTECACGRVGADGRQVASSRAVLEEQLTCGKVERPCPTMQKAIENARQGQRKERKEKSALTWRTPWAVEASL